MYYLFGVFNYYWENKMKLLLAMLLLASTAQAEVKIVYLNKCQDFDWPCVNQTQSADSENIRRQVVRACRKRKCPIIYSIDPLIDRNGDYNFGAWIRHRYVFFAADPTCPHAREILERTLDRLNIRVKPTKHR
jgi:hypothetical protein